MPTTKAMRVLTVLVECEKENGPIGPALAERAYKIEGLNNCIVLTEGAVVDVHDVQAIADSFERLAMRQHAENVHGKPAGPALVAHKACEHVCAHALRGGCKNGVCEKAFTLNLR